MGIYDRDYYQESQPGLRLSGPRLMVTNLVIINVVIYIGLAMAFSTWSIGAEPLGFWSPWLAELALQPDMFTSNWKLWQLVTYGFLHANIWHILGNMFCLWFFGRDVETRYGQRTFLLFYLSTIILSGLIGSYTDKLIFGEANPLIGASGGAVGVLVVYIALYPRRTLLFWGVLPMPAWVIGVIVLLPDFLNAFSRVDKVAHTAHLGGAALGWLFFKTGWHLFRWIPQGKMPGRLRRPSGVRIHRPEGDDDTELSAEVDRILEKIGREGEASLTRKERRTLERASRRYQQRQR